MWRGTQTDEENLVSSIISILDDNQKDGDCTAMITKLKKTFAITPEG